MPSTPLEASRRSAAPGWWFTSSTRFANPAITIVRSLSNSFAGIAPGDVPIFVVAQLLGAAMGALAKGRLFDHGRTRTADDGCPAIQQTASETFSTHSG